MEKAPDISIFVPNWPEVSETTKNQLNKNRKYLQKCFVTYEIIDTISEAKGDFVSIFQPDTFYFDYTLHVQWRSLWLFNKKKITHSFIQSLVYDTTTNEFYCIKNEDFRFYKRVPSKNQLKDKESKTPYIEDKIFPGCKVTKEPLEALETPVPEDNALMVILFEINNLVDFKDKENGTTETAITGSSVCSII
jgi:hypothetical protein